MSGLIFEDRAPAETPAPSRADVACFVGFVARRPPDGTSQVVPPAGARTAGGFPLYAWLEAQGWTSRPFEVDAAGVNALYGRRARPEARAGEDPAKVFPPPPWTRDDAGIESLLDLPVPLDSWEQFDRLF